jgi:hypothetical protein
VARACRLRLREVEKQIGNKDAVHYGHVLGGSRRCIWSTFAEHLDASQNFIEVNAGITDTVVRGFPPAPNLNLICLFLTGHWRPVIANQNWLEIYISNLDSTWLFAIFSVHQHRVQKLLGTSGMPDKVRVDQYEPTGQKPPCLLYILQLIKFVTNFSDARHDSVGGRPCFWMALTTMTPFIYGADGYNTSDSHYLFKSIEMYSLGVSAEY